MDIVVDTQDTSVYNYGSMGGPEPLELSMSDVLVTPLVKQGLKEKIQTRRLAEGAGELHVQFLPAPQYPLSPDEQVKVDNRKMANRKSANESREKRKHREESLSEEKEELEKERMLLQAEVAKYKTTKETMEQLMKFHDSLCTGGALLPVSLGNPNPAASTTSDCLPDLAQMLGSSDLSTYTSYAVDTMADAEGDGAPCCKKRRVSGEEKIACLVEFLKADTTVSYCDMFVSPVEMDTR